MEAIDKIKAKEYAKMVLDAVALRMSEAKTPEDFMQVINSTRQEIDAESITLFR